MKKPTILTISIISLATLSAVLLLPGAIVSAQTNSGGQALEIAPPVINLTADPGQTIQTKINIRDVSTSNLIVTGQINDFVAGGENGIPRILMDASEKSPYSIKDWIAPLSQLTLESKKTKDLLLTIHVPINAAPGGYYGVVRFTAAPPELKDTGLALSASLGALILLRVNGDAKENLSIESFYAKDGDKTGWLFETTPIQFVERLKNSGNIHEQPAGLVTITDMFGKKVATVGVNQPPGNILPQSIRKFEQPLDSSIIGNKMLFGRYKAVLSVTYGASNNVITKSIEFWVIPYRLIGVIIVLLIIAFIVLYFLIKRYNRYVVKRAQGTQASHKKHRK